MENLKKSYSIVYDKNKKQYAIDLQRFVSETAGTKCMMFKVGKAPDNVTDIDKSYVIYLGEESSKYMNYENKFEQYGLQMGWYGTNAWIRLIKQGDGSFSAWLNKGELSIISDNDKEIARNANRYKKFCGEYYDLYREYKLRGDKAIDQSYTKSAAIDKMTKDFQFLRSKWVDFFIAPWGIAKGFIGDSQAYKRINRFAVMYFYKNYLKSFLNE